MDDAAAPGEGGTAILGAGAIGGSVAALLARAGIDVALIARGKTLEELRARGSLRLEGAAGSFEGGFASSIAPSGRPESSSSRRRRRT